MERSICGIRFCDLVLEIGYPKCILNSKFENRFQKFDCSIDCWNSISRSFLNSTLHQECIRNRFSNSIFGVALFVAQGLSNLLSILSMKFHTCIHTSADILVSRGRTLFSRRGVMACSMNPRECTYTTSDNAPARKQGVATRDHRHP